jgi:DNA-binding NarL/FixJ family response regulator
MFDDDYSVFTAMRAGARGYVLKDADEEEVLRSIRAVGHGEAIFSPAIARRMVDFFAVPRSGTPPQAFPQLSQREREVLGLIAQGVNNAAIADRLCLSPKRCAITFRTFSASSRLPIAPKRSSARGKPG